MKKKKVIIHANNLEWQRRYTRHVIQGLKRHGIKAAVTNDPKRQPCDIAILMGPNAWQRVERAPGQYLMLNRKLVGNGPQVVHENCAISWNGFNGYGTFCVDEVDPKRLERYMKENEFEDWKRNGKAIVYGEQSNVGRSTNYRTLAQYYKFVERNAKKLGGTARRKRKPIGEDKISFKSVRKSLLNLDPHVYVNLNSTISLECLSVGIPVISLDKGDPAYPITSHDMNIHYPDNRLEFYQYLAHCQWTENEIKSGEFWDHIYPISGPKLYEWRGNGSTR